MDYFVPDGKRRDISTVETGFDERHVWVSFATDLPEKVARKIRCRLGPTTVTFYLEDDGVRDSGWVFFGFVPQWSYEVTLPTKIETDHYKLNYNNGVVDCVLDRAISQLAKSEAMLRDLQKQLRDSKRDQPEVA